VLQGGANFRRLGGLRPIRAKRPGDCRDQSKSGRGRQREADFDSICTIRLNVFRHSNSAHLRERREDIVILARAFLEERARFNGWPPCGT